MTAEVLTILALLGDARVESRVENVIRRHSKVKSRTYIEEPDKNRVSRVRVAVYLVEADDPRLLKSSLKGLEKHRAGLEIIVR